MAIRGVTTRLIGGDSAKAIGAAIKTTRITIVLFTIAPHLFRAQPGWALPKSKLALKQREQRVRDFTFALTGETEVCDGEVRFRDGAA